MRIHLPADARECLVASLRLSERYVNCEDREERLCARRSVKVADYLDRIREVGPGVIDIRADYFAHVVPIIIADFTDFHHGLSKSNVRPGQTSRPE